MFGQREQSYRYEGHNGGEIELLGGELLLYTFRIRSQDFFALFWLLLVFPAILIFGILTLWVPNRWPLTIFQLSLFALAIVKIFRLPRANPGEETPDSLAPTQAKRLPAPGFWLLAPGSWLLASASAWGLLQIATHRTIYELKTWESVLNWTTNLVAFSLALHFGAPQRERFLRSILSFTFLLSILATFTALTSPPGRVFWFWRFDIGTDLPTLGSFGYRNQYASFVEAVLPLAIVGAILNRRRTWLYTLIAAMLFASVVTSASRAGAILCLAEIVFIPVLAFNHGLISGRSLARVLGGSILAGTLLTGVVGWQVIWNRLQEPNPYSLRAQLLRSSLEMARDRPLMGFGLGTWSSAYPAYAHFDDGRFVNQAHNDWAQWLAEGGVPFFLIMLSIAALAVRPALRSLWGLGLLAVFTHCLLDYPMQQRPALATFFFALLGTLFTQHRTPSGSEWV